MAGTKCRPCRFVDKGSIRADVFPHASSDQPPPCCWGARAAAGPTIRSNSACGPVGPWMGACVTTSSFKRLMLLYSTIELLLTLAGAGDPAGGGPPMSALTSSLAFGRYAIVILSLWLR